MKTLLTTTILLLATLTLTAQPACQVDEHAYDHWRLVNATNHQVQDRSVTVLPVVVHVLYPLEFFDIPDSEIQDIIAQVNRDFRRQNADTINTPDAFKPVAADTEIEFALASIAPDGSATSGVTHTQTNSLSVPNIFETQLMKFDSTGGKSAWDTEHYVNIWLLSGPFFGGGNSVYPSEHGTPIDGVTVPNFNLNDDLRFTEELLTHHLGHYLGLRHLYGWNGCSIDPGGNDGLTDTPNQFESSGLLVQIDSCLAFPTTDVCSPDFPGIMFMNYMDDTYAGCANLFTQQQAELMNMVIDSIRFSLLGSPNTAKPALVKSGDMEAYPNPVREHLNIALPHLSAAQREYRLFDQFGRLVLMSVLEDGEVSRNDRLDVAGLSAGVYLLYAKAGDAIFFNKIIKL